MKSVRLVLLPFCPRGGGGRGACMAGGVRGKGACVAGCHAWQGVSCMAGACMAGVCAWQGGRACQGACMVGGGCGRGCVWQGACVADTMRYGQ